jgi:hypothetical protein
MPVHKTDRSFRKRHFANFVTFGVPFVLVCLFAIHAYQRGRSDWFIGACAVGFVVGLAGLVRQQRQSSRYHCPQCGTLLPYSPHGKEKRIQYLCARCDIIWDTEMMEGNAP